jgi:hypothetical protein
MIGAEERVARADGHADELVSAGRIGPEGLAELTTLAHEGTFYGEGLWAKFRSAWPMAAPRVTHRAGNAMYLATRNKPRKTNRKRSVRNKAKLAAKNRGRRLGLQK